MTNQVAVAHEHAAIAQAVYDKYVEDCLNNPDDPLNWSEIDKLGKIANDADSKLLAAKHDALNPQECTCLPDLPDGRINGGRGRVCDAHAAEDNDEIPYGGE